jgi:HEAT repeat protein
MRKKRLLLVIAALALLVAVIMLLNPYPRQLLFGPKVKGVPLCAWQEEVRHAAFILDDPDDEEGFVARILSWLSFGGERPNSDRLSVAENESVLITMAADPRPKVRSTVVLFLIKTKSATGIATLMNFLDDPEDTVVRSVCVDGWSAPMREAAFPKLKTMLNNPDPERRIMAMERIRHDCVWVDSVHVKEALELLVGMLDDQEYLVRLRALELAGSNSRWTRQRSTRFALPILTRFLTDEDAHCRVAAAAAIWNISPQSKNIVGAYRKEIHSTDAGVRTKTIEGLRLLGKDCLTAWDELVHCALKDPDGGVRKAAVEALPHGGSKAVPILLLVMEDSQRDVRKSAVEALIKIGPDAKAAAPVLLSRLGEFGDLALQAVGSMKAKESVPALLALLDAKDETPVTTKAVVRALGDIGPDAKPAVPKLEKILSEPPSKKGGKAAAEAAQKMRGHAATALAKIGGNPKILVPVLADLAAHQYDEVSQAIGLDGLYHLGPLAREAVPVLRKTFALGLMAQRWRYDSAVEVVGAIGPEAKAAIPDLLRILRDEDSYRRALAAETLGKIGQEAGTVVPALAPLLQERSRLVRLAAIRALARFGPNAKHAIPPLAALLEDDDEYVSEAAADALTAIDPARYPKRREN